MHMNKMIIFKLKLKKVEVSIYKKLEPRQLAVKENKRKIVVAICLLIDTIVSFFLYYYILYHFLQPYITLGDEGGRGRLWHFSENNFMNIRSDAKKCQNWDENLI